jgi:cyanate permease
MKQWQKWWLLFAVMWGVVAAIQVGVILGVSEEPEKAWQPALLGVAVPAALYLVMWLWNRFISRDPNSGTEP